MDILSNLTNLLQIKGSHLGNKFIANNYRQLFKSNSRIRHFKYLWHLPEDFLPSLLECPLSELLLTRPSERVRGCCWPAGLLVVSRSGARAVRGSGPLGCPWELRCLGSNLLLPELGGRCSNLGFNSEPTLEWGYKREKWKWGQFEGKISSTTYVHLLRWSHGKQQQHRKLHLDLAVTNNWDPAWKGYGSANPNILYLNSSLLPGTRMIGWFPPGPLLYPPR